MVVPMQYVAIHKKWETERMSNGRSFKSDESFLEKISIGAVGTCFVFNNLKEQGHTPVELERGSMSFKIWKNIKIKRVRVPDILCVNCGTRIESRAKTKLEITMSHSTSDPNRGWDFGLEDSDYVALVRCEKVGSAPIDWNAVPPVQYIAVSDLRNAYRSEHVIQENSKGAQEGFEKRITWPATIASSDGTICSISENRLQFSRSQDNRKITLKLIKKGVNLEPLVEEGELIQQGQILASVVPVRKQMSCGNNKRINDYLSQLISPSLSDRYAAIKAISVMNVERAREALKDRMTDLRDHVYIRLEAAATLMRIGDNDGIQFLQQMINDEYLENRLETIIILGEIKSPKSLEILSDVLLDNNQNPEIRAAAAWSLGELGLSESIQTLIQGFDEVDDLIKIEAARALAKLADDNTSNLIEQFKETSTNRRPGIAWALGRQGKFTVTDILSCLMDDDTRQWVAYIIGSKNESDYIEQIEELREKDSEVYFAVTVLWKIVSSWVHNLEEY